MLKLPIAGGEVNEVDINSIQRQSKYDSFSMPNAYLYTLNKIRSKFWGGKQ